MLGQAGLPKIRFHDLRQTACSLLLGAGVSIVAASGTGGDLAATPEFCGTTSTLQIRKKKH
jgi:integrase